MAKIDGDLAEALGILNDFFKGRNIPFAIVGALVPVILLNPYAKGFFAGVRETRDADHAIKITSWTEWDEIIDGLVKLGFKRARGEQEHKLYYRQAEIDLIPYGITDGPLDVLIWRKSGNKMNLSAFSDVFHYAVPIEVMPGLTLPIVPLWLFAVLKVLAYVDRELARDMADLAHVLEHYEAPNESSRRFDVLDSDGEVVLETAGSYLLGYDVCRNASPEAVEVVGRFIKGIEDEYHPVVNAILTQEKLTFSDEYRKRIFELFRSFWKGFNQ